ncbi:MAG: hypothetical protein ACRDSF_00085 [Pseudonocardiaceae bacterium]
MGRDDSAARIAELEAQLNQTKEEGEKWKIILDKLGAVLNPDQQQTPEQLAEALKQRDEELKERNLELAVYSVAGAQAGSTLLDSRRFRDSIKGMEPGTDAFTAKITEAVGKLSPTQTAPPGTPSKGAGADLGGGKGGDGNAQLTKEQMEGMTHKEIMAAYRAGQFNDLIKAK